MDTARSGPRSWIRRVAHPLVALVLLVAVACGGAVSDEHTIDEPAAVEPIQGSGLARITLTRRAAERLEIASEPIVREGRRIVAPSSAVLVDPNGRFWVYTVPEPLVFVRAAIGIDHQDGSRAILSSGPPPGTPVVTVGVAELYGAETGIDH